MEDGQSRSSTDEVDVIFGGNIDDNLVSPSGCEWDAGSALTGSLFKKMSRPQTIIAGLIGGVVLVLMAFFVSSIFRRGKMRN